MENLSYEALVQLVTSEVLKALSKDNKNNKPAALVVGDEKNLPSFAEEKYCFADIEAYQGDITDFECVFVAEITLAQLADSAIGRDEKKVPCALTKAFLCGKKVYILESALPHRSYKETANRKLYAMIEGYVNTLRSFGAEIIRDQWHGKNLDKNAISDNSVDKVITEKLAISLCEKAENGIVKLKKETVITPSAKDIFNHSDIKVKFVD